MTSIIYSLHENGKIKEEARYTTSPKRALICYIMQYKHNNWNTWTYPEDIDGIEEYTGAKNHYRYDDGNIIFSAFPNR